MNILKVLLQIINGLIWSFLSSTRSTISDWPWETFLLFSFWVRFLEFQLGQSFRHYPITLVSKARLSFAWGGMPHVHCFCHVLTNPAESNSTTMDAKYFQLCPAFFIPSVNLKLVPCTSALSSHLAQLSVLCPCSWM